MHPSGPRESGDTESLGRPACLGTQPLHTWVHQLQPCRLRAVRSRQPGKPCLGTCSHHPCGQPGATKCGWLFSAQTVQRCGAALSVPMKTLPRLGDYSIFCIFHNGCILHTKKLRRKNLHMGKTIHVLFRTARCEGRPL